MGENITLTHLNECKLGVIGMSREVFKTVTASSQKTQGFVKVGLILRSRILTTKLNGTTENATNEASGGLNIYALVGDIVLQASVGINSKLPALINRSTKTTIILPSIVVVIVILGTNYKSAIADSI